MKHFAAVTRCAVPLLMLFVIPCAQGMERLPSEIVNLQYWKLTLPFAAEGQQHASEISAAELSKFSDERCFFVNDAADGVVFRAICGGATTKGSKYPRCELREMDTANRNLAAWSTDDSCNHRLNLTIAITKVPPVKPHVVCAQIHDADDDLLMIRLEGTKLLIERTNLDDVALDSSYQLGTPLKLRIETEDGVVRVFYNEFEKLVWRVSRDGCYFKAGCYTQSNLQRGDAVESYAEVVIYDMLVAHRFRD